MKINLMVISFRLGHEFSFLVLVSIDTNHLEAVENQLTNKTKLAFVLDHFQEKHANQISTFASMYYGRGKRKTNQLMTYRQPPEPEGSFQSTQIAVSR